MVKPPHQIHQGFGRVLVILDVYAIEKAITEFNRSDIRLVICPSADWKLAIINDFIERMNPYDSNREWIYVFHPFGKADKKQIRKTLQTNHVLFFPFVSNPYSQSRNEQKNIQAVLDEAMLMSGIECGLK